MCVRVVGSLQILDSKETDEGKYECVAENSAGVAYSYGANLYVRGQSLLRAPPGGAFSIGHRNSCAVGHIQYVTLVLIGQYLLAVLVEGIFEVFKSLVCREHHL